jgi:ribonuclease HII
LYTPPETLLLFAESASPSKCDAFFYEGLARDAGYDLIAGTDEAGRGPLAGPVVAATVVIPKGAKLSGIRDSKKMTEKAREAAFPVVHQEALAVGIGVVPHHYIDKFNILNASLEAMRRAVLALNPRPEFLLVDGIHKVPASIPQQCLKKGDAICRSISAASVVAKVYRDRIMRSYHKQYPVYDFQKNKGYGTAEHLEALKRYGPSPIHRLTFKGVASFDKGTARTGQIG